MALEQRVSELERWRELVGPMLNQLAEDQAYRARWRAERNKRWSRWQRQVGFAFAGISAVTVLAAALLNLAHLF